PQAFVADELNNADGLVHRRLLGRSGLQVVLVAEHLPRRLHRLRRLATPTRPMLSARTPVCQGAGPFIPRLKAGAFPPFSVTRQRAVLEERMPCCRQRLVIQVL